MPALVDYYFSLNSPWAYLGSQRFAEICGRHGARVNARPVDYGQIFPQSGGLPLAKRAPQRQAYRLAELKRWREHLGIKLNLQPKYFPADESLAARLVVAARETGLDVLPLAHAIARAVWAEERNIAEPATLRAIALDCRLEPQALFEAAETESIKAAYQAGTDAAIAAQVFGAPTYALNGELFWGQDRLEFVDRALARSSARG